MTKTKLIWIPIDKLLALRRNPQYLSERQSLALRRSIEQDGFLAPIVVREKGQNFEVLSGNHRVQESREVGLSEIPCVLIESCDDETAARIAINMNTVHGDPTAELLAPFLSEMADETLKSVFLDEQMLEQVREFDATLQQRLTELSLTAAFDHDSPKGSIPNCVCKCGHRHVAALKPSELSKSAPKTISASKTS